MIRISRAARLSDRQKPLVAGGCQKRLSRREAAVESADPDFRSLGYLVQRDACASLQEQLLRRDENALAVPFRVGT